MLRPVWALVFLVACDPLWAAWEVIRFVPYEGKPIDAPDRRSPTSFQNLKNFWAGWPRNTREWGLPTQWPMVALIR